MHPVSICKSILEHQFIMCVKKFGINNGNWQSNYYLAFVK